MRSRVRSRRDASALPKSMVAKKRAIDKATRDLGSAALATRDAHTVMLKIFAAAERLAKHARQKEEWTYEQSNALEDSARKAALEARDRAAENYKTYLQEQLTEARQREREARPDPGTYQHELALMRGGRDARRARRRPVRRR